MRLPKDLTLTQRFLLLCEGPSDKAFFEHLLALRNIPNFQVINPRDTFGEAGRSRFTELLNAITVAHGFDKVEGILIQSDNDLDPGASFHEVQESIRQTAPYNNPSRRYSVPDHPLVKAGENPAVVIMMLPWGNEAGNLETICLTAASNRYPDLRKCVNSFTQCANTDTWNLGKLSKMKLRSMIAASYERNPDLSLTYLWDDHADLVPLNDAVFDRISDYLKSFEQVITG